MADTLIYCFTGTGNSLQAAKEIQGIIGDAEIRPILSGKTDRPNKYKKIGFVFPVYFWGLPIQVDEFLKSLDLSSNTDTYYFTVATCGSSDGNAIPMVGRLLRKKGVNLHYAKKIYMVSNYILMYDVKDLTEEGQQRYSAEIREIAAAVQEGKNVPIRGENIFSKLIYYVSRTRFANTDKKFTVENCTGCGICENICPAKNISVNSHDNTVEFHHRCQQCCACIHYCPAQAINYKNKTSDRQRYQNPQISLPERQAFYKE
jgi:ferredoxin/flavodoxin